MSLPFFVCLFVCLFAVVIILFFPLLELHEKVCFITCILLIMGFSSGPGCNKTELDSAIIIIHRINCYPEDKYYENQLYYPLNHGNLCSG